MISQKKGKRIPECDFHEGFVLEGKKLLLLLFLLFY